MSDDQRRKPLFGAKGPLPDGAGRYSLSSKPPKADDGADKLGATLPLPQPAHLPPEFEIEEPEQIPLEGRPLRGASERPPRNDRPPLEATHLGMAAPPPQRLQPRPDLKRTLAFGSAEFQRPADLQPSAGLRDQGPRTVRGTAPPPGYNEGSDENLHAAAHASSEPPAQAFQSAPPSPHTQRATVPPAKERSKRDPFLLAAEPARVTRVVNWSLDPKLVPVCDELGEACVEETEVALLISTRHSRDAMALSALAIARRLGQALPGEVVLVETDFENPILASTLGVTVPHGAGFSEQLHQRAWGQGTGPVRLMGTGMHFDALLEGRFRTPGLVWSDEFARIIGILRQAYRLVVLVAPARLTAVDHHALDDVTDSVYSIVRADDPRARTALTTGTLAPKLKRTVTLG